PFSAFADCAAGAFRWTSGAEHVRAHRSTDPVERTFCDTCGSRLTFRHDALAARVWIAVGTLDEDPGIRPSAHIFVGSAAAWSPITDGLPQFAEYPPFDE